MSMTDVRKIRTICSISPCPSSDGVVATVRNGKVIKTEGDKDHPWSKGHTCPKGRHEWEVLYHPKRFKQPLLKTPSGRKEISWEEAIEVASERLGEVRVKYGPLSICSTLPSPSLVLFTRSVGSPNEMTSRDLCQGTVEVAGHPPGLRDPRPRPQPEGVEDRPPGRRQAVRLGRRRRTPASGAASRSRRRVIRAFERLMVPRSYGEPSAVHLDEGRGEPQQRAYLAFLIKRRILRWYADLPSQSPLAVALRSGSGSALNSAHSSKPSTSPSAVSIVRSIARTRRTWPGSSSLATSASLTTTSISEGDSPTVSHTQQRPTHSTPTR